MTATNIFTAATTARATEVNQNFAELGLLGYAQVTANQGTFTTATDLTGLTLTVTISTAFAAAGRRIKITGVTLCTSSVSTDLVGLVIAEGATTIQQDQKAQNETLHVEAIITPTSGSHTYKLQALRTAGTGNITSNASSSRAAFILIEAI